ncbi:hypothetical protein K3U94_07105 [Mycolicibacter heraklionensis]|uniref:Uncharacterized protein n=1 Tax=Mycolicibacter heraklionensis TaxID=512402 RepID=A0A9X7WIY5_9MYCO|nr:hypothetical protein [Mycolicibacter heraklionensis]QZA09023.1 hypothetical protein K3U94_07105 [Mycolicibacter heraklionensis]
MATKVNETTAAEQWIDQLDPADPSVKVRAGRYLRHVREAAEAADAATDALRRAVAEARENGESWGTIGMVLGVSRQAVQQRFRDV